MFGSGTNKQTDLLRNVLVNGEQLVENLGLERRTEDKVGIKQHGHTNNEKTNKSGLSKLDSLAIFPNKHDDMGVIIVLIDAEYSYWIPLLVCFNPCLNLKFLAGICRSAEACSLCVMLNEAEKLNRPTAQRGTAQQGTTQHNFTAHSLV